MEVVPRLSLYMLVVLLTVTVSHARCYYTRDGRPECRVERIPIGKGCFNMSTFCFWPSVCDGSVKECRIPEGDSCAGKLANFCVPGTTCDNDICKRTLRLEEKCDDADHVICDDTMFCDKDSGYTCRRKVGNVCRKDSDCSKKGVRCMSGICKIQLGEKCTGQEDHCAAGSACDDAGLCKIQLGGSCASNKNHCWTGSVCSDAGFCQIQIGDNCAGKGQHCLTGSDCDNLGCNTCKIKQGGDCTNHAKDCVTGSTCVTGTMTCEPASCDGVFEPVGDHCLKFTIATMNYNQSEDNCKTLGGHLWMPKTQLTLDETWCFLKGKGTFLAWVGANDRASAGSYKWNDGTDLFDNSPLWNDGEPSKPLPGNDCVVIVKASDSFRLYSRQCQYNYIPHVCAPDGE